jgi:hypothetical protein
MLKVISAGTGSIILEDSFDARATQIGLSTWK